MILKNEKRLLNSNTGRLEIIHAFKFLKKVNLQIEILNLELSIKCSDRINSKLKMLPPLLSI